MLRVGSLVTVVRMDDNGEWFVPNFEDDSTTGIVIAIESDDCDGYDKIESLTIRWNNGKVEVTKPEGDDEKGPWEIADATPALYANLYLHDRAYGGPEEGGWWYDTYTPVDGDWMNEPPPYGHFRTEDEAEKALVKLIEWCEEENKSRRSPSSVASEGHFVARLESWPAEPIPARRPHYC